MGEARKLRPIDAGALEALREVKSFVDRSPHMAAEIVRLLDELSELFVAEIDTETTCGADEFFVIYKPSDGLNRIRAAIRARDMEQVGFADVSIFGHDEAPSSAANLTDPPVLV